MEEREDCSYRYWVRGSKGDAVPLPEPKKVSSASGTDTPLLGSLWNKAGTWEEKSLNKWASLRLKDLILSLSHLHFSTGNAHISDLSKCHGDAFLVTVRNKKRVGYSYELSLDVTGEWLIGHDSTPKPVKAHLHIPDISFGELDDLQFQVKVNDDDLSHPDKMRITHDLNQFLEPLRQKLLQFEQELKDR